MTIKDISSFILFMLLVYGAIWALFGIGKWLVVPLFSSC